MPQTKKIINAELKCSHGPQELLLPLNAIILSVEMVRRGYVRVSYLMNWPQVEKDYARKLYFAFTGYAVPERLHMLRFIGTVDAPAQLDIVAPITVHIFEGEIVP